VTLVNIKVGEHISTHTSFSVHATPLGIALAVVGIALLLAGAVLLVLRRRRRAQASHSA
jgi:LPXTG-motif cell wall-anchored protein